LEIIWHKFFSSGVKQGQSYKGQIMKHKGNFMKIVDSELPDFMNISAHSFISSVMTEGCPDHTSLCISALPPLNKQQHSHKFPSFMTLFPYILTNWGWILAEWFFLHSKIELLKTPHNWLNWWWTYLFVKHCDTATNWLSYSANTGDIVEGLMLFWIFKVSGHWPV
jgi:hypothetical protein